MDLRKPKDIELLGAISTAVPQELLEERLFITWCQEDSN